VKNLLKGWVWPFFLGFPPDLSPLTWEQAGD
jgi:hypothetical protein